MTLLGSTSPQLRRTDAGAGGIEPSYSVLETEDLPLIDAPLTVNSILYQESITLYPLRRCLESY